MSRSGYHHDGEHWALICWRGAVRSAMRGARGQTLLRTLRDALDSMPEKKLIANELITTSGECCALGRVAQVQGIGVEDVDPEDREAVAKLFNIAPALAAEIVYENDERAWRETPEERWQRMREWVEKQILSAG